MSNTPRNLTRNQLAEFLPNARAVRAFEQMLKFVGELYPNDPATLNRLIEEANLEATQGSAKAQSALDTLSGIIQNAAIDAGTADGKATTALDALSSIAQSLEVLAKAPPPPADNLLKTDYIDFSLTPRYSMTPGRVHWGPTGTLEIEMGGGNITQQVGEEFFVYGKATAAITEGQLIMVTGAVGASSAVTFAPTSTGLLDPNAILGIATENIPLNGFGRVTTMGVVHGIDTTGSGVGETWVDGDILWYNTGFVGGMTRIKPVAPNMKTQVAIVIHAGSGGSGSLQVEVINGSTLGGTDTNVQLGALADKQLLQYDAAAGYWKNVALSASGVVTSVGLSAPVGLTVSGSPVTSSGTLALSFTAGYSIPTTASQTNWGTAYTNTLRWNGGATGLVAATGRTSLGATTLGSNLFTLANVAAISFPRFNADNTVSSLDAASFRTAIGAGTGNGTVTSVTGTAPIASSGGATPAIRLNAAYGDTLNPYASKTANFFLAAPNGAAGVPTFRALVAADVPTLNQNTTGTASNVTGTVAVANGGTGLTSLATNYIPWGNGTGAYSSSNAFKFTGSILAISVPSVTPQGKIHLGDGTDNSTTVKSTEFLVTADDPTWVGSGGSFQVNRSWLSVSWLSLKVSNGASRFIAMDVNSDGSISPGADNAYSCGTSAKRWSVVYAGTGAINTSDANTKCQVEDLNEAEMRVAARLKKLIKKFKFKDAVEEKGDAARIHVGAIAQDVQAAFEAEGLDAGKYALFCSDTWYEKEVLVQYEAEEGEEPRTELKLQQFKEPVDGATKHVRLGLRYDQLLAFIISSI
jgi:hypothetical protein